MKRLTLLLSLSLLMLSCDNLNDASSGDNTKENGGVINPTVNINICSTFVFVPVDANGNNLLKVEKPLTIEDFDIVLYDSKGKPYYFYNRMLGCPKNIDISGEWGGNDWVNVYLNGSKDKSSNIGITYLRIGKNIHTIKGEWEITYDESANENYIGYYSEVVKKIWFDDVLIYDGNTVVFNPAEGNGLPQITIL
jgi:hypothetical protein